MYTRHLYLYLVVLLAVIVLTSLVPYPSFREPYINFECKVVKNEGSSSTCDGYGTIADEATNQIKLPDGGMKLQKYIKCCKPEEPRVCIYKTCAYEDDYKWLLQAPTQVKEIEIEGQQTKKVAIEGKIIAIDARNIAVDARARAKKAQSRADEAWELADKAYRSSSAGSQSAEKDIKEIKKDIAELKSGGGGRDEVLRNVVSYLFYRNKALKEKEDKLRACNKSEVCVRETTTKYNKDIESMDMTNQEYMSMVNLKW